MTVYLVPVGSDRYQLYVEIPIDEPDPAGPPSEGKGWISRLIARQVHRFRTLMADAERARLKRESGQPDEGSGLWHAIMKRIAETVAEQRLLWHLRHQTEAEVLHPDDIDGAAALNCVRGEFARDVSRHRLWMIVDGTLMIATAIVFTLIPGPNLIAWYFTFRAIGHFFSWRGATRGLTGVAWRTATSAPLAAVRPALSLPTHERRLRLLHIGEQIGLKHLAGFVERVSTRKR
jgi:hypothetical protein